MSKIEIEIPKGKRAEWVDGVLTLVNDTPGEPNEVIRNLYQAECYLEPKYIEFDRVPTQNYEALSALRDLLVIAEAWNKIDGFVPDFSNRNQWKYFPWFTYNDDAARFVFQKVNYTAPDANAYFGSRLCFQTASRAEQFGKQFIDLFNKVFLP